MKDELSDAVPCSSLAVDSILRVGTAGLVAGVFTVTRCGIQRYRRRDDWVNGLVAGAVAGAAVAAGTRSWTHVLGMAGLVSVCSAAADFSRTN